MPLSEQDGFEHGQQGIGGTAAMVSKVAGSLTIQVLFDRLLINHLIQLQQWEAVGDLCKNSLLMKFDA